LAEDAGMSHGLVHYYFGSMDELLTQTLQRLTDVHARFRGIFEHYFGEAMREYGLDETQFPLKVIVAAASSFQLGLIVEGQSNVNEGHAELLDWIQSWVDSLDAARIRS
jgi:AcrR family transcriptional regulator